MSRFASLSAALLLSLLQAAFAGTPIDERRPLESSGRVQVSNVAGSVRVSAWDRPEVHVTGELGEGAEKLEISGDARALRIEVRVPRRSDDAEDTELTLLVPAGASLEVDTVSADIAVQGLKGAVKANTVSGDLNLSLTSADVQAHTVSGDLSLRAPSKNTVLNSVSGDLQVQGPSGQLRLETVSGNIDLAGGPFSSLQLKSISGDMELDAALTDDGRLTGETLSGQLTVRLPASTSAAVSLRSFSGEVLSTLGGAGGEARERIEFKLGDGRGRIDLSSFSGDIRLDKR